mgnify:FL=1
MPEVFSKTEHLCRLPNLLHELQLTCCWVTALARIWPGSILAAPAGVGAAAADMLMLCCRYVELVSRMHRINQLFATHYQQQDMQQQQQLQLLQLPAADITAAVLHTASLLLLDLSKHLADHTSPQGVNGLLLNSQALYQTALAVATLFGSQLQLHLLHDLQQQDSQPAQHSSSGSNGGSSSGSSSGGPPAAAERAEGVLLYHVQHFVQPQKPQVMQPKISSPVVQSWLQHFEASWGEVLPQHQLPRIAAAIAAAEGGSPPQQHPIPSATMAAQEGGAYKLLAPEHCLADAAAEAGDGSTAAGVSAGSSSGGSGGSGSSGCGLVNTQQCINFVEAAGRVLKLGSTQQAKLDGKHQPMCQLISHSPGMQRVPVLLLPSIVAALWLKGVAALDAVFSISYSAGLRVVHGWCQSSRDSECHPCAVCAELLAPHLWPTVVLLSLLLQQVTSAEDRVHFLAVAESSGGSGSSGGNSSGGPTANAAGAIAAAITAGCEVAGLPKILEANASFLQVALSLAQPRSTPFILPRQQLQQLALSVQILEAAIRSCVRLRQLVLQHGNAAAAASSAGGAGFGVDPMLTLATGMCSIAVHFAHVTYDATPGDMPTEVQQVLQAVMSLLLTTLSTAQGQPGAAVPAVLSWCVKVHYLQLKNAADVAAAGATGPVAAAVVAAGWFVVGRCLLQLSEQLQLCILQPESYPLSGWLLASAQVSAESDPTGRTLDHEAARKELDQLLDTLSLLSGAAVEWQRRVLAPQAASINSSSTATMYTTHLDRYQLNMLTADHCLTQEVCQASTMMTNPDVLAAILDPSPTHHWQQLLQQHDGPALQAFLALGTASTGLKYAGNLLCEALPNRYFCNNPGCRNAAGVSAGFALVRGAACVCGGCVGSEGAAGATAAPREAVAAR